MCGAVLEPIVVVPRDAAEAHPDVMAPHATDDDVGSLIDVTDARGRGAPVELKSVGTVDRVSRPVASVCDGGSNAKKRVIRGFRNVALVMLSHSLIVMIIETIGRMAPLFCFRCWLTCGAAGEIGLRFRIFFFVPQFWQVVSSLSSRRYATLRGHTASLQRGVDVVRSLLRLAPVVVGFILVGHR